MDEQNTSSTLSRYVQSLGHQAIAFDPDHGFGFLHRLDVPSSGLVLVAKTYKAYYDLQLQLNVGTLSRDYIVLYHGWLSPELREISARIYWIKDSGLPSKIQREGKPARTCVKVLAHTWRGTGKYSIVSVRIITGRQHQIRAHTAHVRHPTVCDDIYADSTTFLSDREWCARNFLHRYRLAFKGGSGAMQETIAPLPLDLTKVLESLEPRNSQSAE